jgi:hypothetical protein
MCCAGASAAHADLLFGGSVRHVFADAELQGSGGGSDVQEVFFDGLGPFDESVTALVDRGGEGSARGFASQVSDFSTSGMSAHAVVQSQLSLGGQLDSAYAGGVSVALADFHVDVRQTFTLSAMISYSGGPDICVVKLREIGGADLFSLEAIGTDGVASLEQDVQLVPGTEYELFGFAGATNLIDAPFSSDEAYAELTFSFMLVPAPASCAAGLVALGFLRRRRG